MGLDANGRVVAGAGHSGIKGVLVKNMIVPGVAGAATITQVTAPGAMAGDTVDVMTHGEIADLSGLTAGTTYYARKDTGALITDPSVADSVEIGFTVEATRLVVNVMPATDSSIATLAAIAALVDSSGGAAANGTIEAIADPADSPATADALRDDLVANTLAQTRNAIKELATKVNQIIAGLAGLS